MTKFFLIIFLCIPSVLFSQENKLHKIIAKDISGKWNGVIRTLVKEENRTKDVNAKIICNFIQNSDSVKGECTTYYDGEVTYYFKGILNNNELTYEEIKPVKGRKKYTNKLLFAKKAVLRFYPGCGIFPREKNIYGMCGGVIDYKLPEVSMNIILQGVPTWDTIRISNNDSFISFDNLSNTDLNGKFLRIQNLNFAKNSFTLLANEDLEKLAAFLVKNPTYQIRLEGHTDDEGDEKYNQTLSEKRAQAVKEFLVKKGAKADNISTKGFGESKPLSDKKEENRRVEVFFEKK